MQQFCHAYMHPSPSNAGTFTMQDVSRKRACIAMSGEPLQASKTCNVCVFSSMCAGLFQRACGSCLAFVRGTVLEMSPQVNTRSCVRLNSDDLRTCAACMCMLDSGAFAKILESSRILSNSLERSGRFPKLPECSRSFRRILETSGEFSNIVEDSRNFRNVLEFSGRFSKF
eukprot:jgi/Bigna1/80514/fgenesh1_pg.71_\